MAEPATIIDPRSRLDTAAGVNIPTGVESRIQAMMGDPRFQGLLPDSQAALLQRAREPGYFQQAPPPPQIQKGQALAEWEGAKADPRYERYTPDQKEGFRKYYYDNYLAKSGMTWEEFDDETGFGFFDRMSGAWEGTKAGMQRSVGMLAGMAGNEELQAKMNEYARSNEAEAEATRFQSKYPEHGAVQLKNALDPEWWLSIVSEMIPGSAPFLATAGAGAAVGAGIGSVVPIVGTGLGALVGGALAGGSMAAFQELGNAYNEYLQKNPGKEEDATEYAFVKAGFTGIINAASIPLGLLGRGTAPLKRALITMVTQGTVGAGDVATGNALKKLAVDPNTNISEGVAKAFIGEALIDTPGFMLAFRKGLNKGADPKTESDAAPEVPADPDPETILAQPPSEEVLPHPDTLGPEGAPIPPAEAEAEATAAEEIMLELEEGEGVGSAVNYLAPDGTTELSGVIQSITPDGLGVVAPVSEGEAAAMESLEPAAPEPEITEPPPVVQEDLFDQPPQPPVQAQPAPVQPPPVEEAQIQPPPVEPAPVEEAPPVVEEPVQEPPPAQEIPPEAPELKQQEVPTAEEAPAQEEPAEQDKTFDAWLEKTMMVSQAGLRKYALKLARGDADRAEDLLQDTNEKTWEKRRTFKRGSGYAAWAKSIMRNIDIDIHRSAKAQKRPEEVYGTEAEAPVAPEQEVAVDKEAIIEEEQEARKKRRIEGEKDPAPAVAEKPISDEESEAAKDRPPFEGSAGSTSEVVTPKGAEVETRFRVVDIDDVITSHSFDGKENADYPQDLQGRDRSKMSSVAGIADRAKALDPRQLADTRLAGDGAPVVGPDKLVESGNGRTLSVKLAYDKHPAKGTKYKLWLASNAGKFGLTKKDVTSLKRPILVRERTTKMSWDERVQFTEDANTGTQEKLNEAELAQQDARRISKILSLFRPAEDGSLDNMDNREFVNRFVTDVVAKGEQNEMTDNSGRPTPKATNRIKNAVFALAYKDTDLLNRLAMSTDDNVRNITNGLMRAAPAIVKQENAAAKGEVSDKYNIAEELASAAKQYAVLRGDGVNVDDYLAQAEELALPGVEHPAKDLSDLDISLLKLLQANRRSAKKIGDAIGAYARHAEGQRIDQESLFGEEEAPTREELIANLTQKESPSAEPAPERTAASVPVESDRPKGSLGDELDLDDMPPIDERFESRASLSRLAEHSEDLRRQYRLAALDARGGDKAAQNTMDTLATQIKAVEVREKLAEQTAVREALAEARKLYGSDAPMVRFVNSLESGVVGEYQASKRLIKVSLEAMDPLGTIRHESMHDFRAWFLNDLENQTLNSAYRADSRASKQLLQTLIKHGHSEAAAQARKSTEERIAHAFSLHMEGRLETRPLMKRIMDKLKLWIERVGGMFAGRGFSSANDIFDTIESGLVGRRKTTRERLQDKYGVKEPAADPDAQQALGKKKRPKARKVKQPVTTLGERAQEFVERDPLAPVEDYTVGQNTTALNYSSEKVNRAINDMARSNGAFLKDRGGNQTWESTMRAAERKVRDGTVTEEKILKWNPRQPKDAATITAAEILLTARTEGLISSAEKAKSGSDEDRARFNILWAENARMQAIIHGAESSAARATQVLQMRPRLAKERAEAIRSLIEEAGGHENLDKLAAAVSAMSDPAQIKSMLEKAYNPNFWDKFQEIWINGLFTPLSLARNAISNTVFNVMQAPETLIAAAIGKTRKGDDKVRAGEALAQLHGLLSTWPEALELAKYTWLTEEGAGPTKLEMRTPKAIAGKKGYWIRTMGRTLMSTDVFFKSIGYRQTLHALAYRNAYNAGYRGDALKAKVKQTMINPDEDLELDAIENSRYLTFTKKAGPIAQSLMDLRNAFPPLKLVLPFINTPVQLLSRAFERSPLGLLMPEVVAAIKEGGAKRDMAISRMLLGSALAGSIAMLAASGAITGDGPSDPSERQQWYLNHAPNSILIGDEWVSYKGLEPFSTIMGMVATWVEQGEQATKKEEESVVGNILAAFFKNVISKQYLQGISDAMLAAADSDRYAATFFNRLAGSLVPGSLAHITRQMDPNLREVKSVFDAWKSRIPGLSETLGARIDVRGEEIRFEGAVGPDIISPIFTKKADSDPVAKELEAVGVTIGRTRPEINGHKLNPQERVKYAKEVGRGIWSRLGQTIKTTRWKKLTPDNKERRVKNIVRYERRRARAVMIRDNPVLRRPARLTRASAQ